jgi:RNA polymerase sigma factor (sigma-70 family)
VFLSHIENYFDAGVLSVENEAGLNIFKSQIDKAVEELPEKRKKIYKLSRAEGLSHKEIADQLNISVKTVENQINLALKHLRDRLGTGALAVITWFFLFV